MANSILEDLPEQTFTESTIRRMYGLIDRAKTDQEFQKLIYSLVNRAMPGQWKDYTRELSTVFNWFKKNVDYRRDPYGVELLQDVWATLDRKRGDCDDATTFLASSAEVLGSPTRIVTVSTRQNLEPNHVYAEAFVGGRWRGMDATVPQSYFGWVPPKVTARRIWTRKELGLSGGEDMEGVEGLGMSDYDFNGNGQGNGYGNEDYRGTMAPVSGKLAPGVPDDISHTRGDAIPGTTSITQRKIWRAPVANNSDWTSNPRPGGGVYGPVLPIAKRPLPQDLWYLVDRCYVPKVLDPDSAWWGKVPTSKEDLNRMFPGSEATMATYLTEIASVPASAIAEISDDVRKQLAMGEIGYADVPDAITEGLEGYALGLPPRMKMPPSQRPARTHVKGRGARYPHPAPPPERRYLVPAPSKQLVPIRGGSLNGLGDIFDDAAKMLSTQVQTGQVPSDPSSISKAVDAVVSVITGKSATPAPATSTSDIAKIGIPLTMLALLGGAAWLMSRSGKTRTYRRNPSRRRSRGGRSGGGGFDVKTALLWGGGGLAAYYLLLRPGGFLMPSVPRTTTGPLIPGVSASQQAAIAAGVKAAPSIFDSISKLFSSGPSSAPSPGSTPSSSGFVTSLPGYSPNAQESTPQFVTDLTAA